MPAICMEMEKFSQKVFFLFNQLLNGNLLCGHIRAMSNMAYYVYHVRI